MSTIGQDSFSRANQSGWGTASDGQSWSLIAGPATTDITSNHGRIGNFNSFTVFRLGSTTTADIDAVVTLMTTGSTLNGAGHAWRCTSSSDLNNLYRAVTFDQAIYIEKFISGVKTTLTNFAFTYTTSSHIKLRMQHLSDQLKVKAWNEGSAEPGSWNYSATESSILSAGYFGLMSDLFGGSGTGVSEYWDYTVTNGATGAAKIRIGDGYGGCFN